MARVVAQRVRRASVSVEGEIVGAIDRGLALLVGIRRGDSESAVDRVADKVATLRMFADDAGKMNLSAADIGGSMLVVSQFTLLADLRRGRRPSFIDAADPAEGERLVQRFTDRLRAAGYRVETGRFGAHMLVEIENDGPVTIVIDNADL